MDCVCSLMPAGRLRACEDRDKKPYNKQLINLKESVFMGNLKPRPYHIGLAIARSMQLGLTCD